MCNSLLWILSLCVLLSAKASNVSVVTCREHAVKQISRSELSDYIEHIRQNRGPEAFAILGHYPFIVNICFDVLEGCTVLMKAVTSHCSSYVFEKVLCIPGVDVNKQQKNYEQWNALMFAVARQQEDKVKLLLKHGADTCLKAQGGMTALHLAVIKLGGNYWVKPAYSPDWQLTDCSRALVPLLMSARGNINEQDQDLVTPLLSAAIHSRVL